METQSIKSKLSSARINFNRKSFKERAELVSNPVAKRLCHIIAAKQTNVGVAADVTTKAELLRIADQVGPHVCLIKTHIDIIEDFDDDLIMQLQMLAQKHNFLIFEDRKFADIGNTVRLQYTAGIYHIADWADMVNAHSLPGPGIIEGIKAGVGDRQRALILLSQMSSSGNLLSPEYSAQTIAMAEQYPEFIIGFIGQHRNAIDDCFLLFTPGVKRGAGGDMLGQQYNTPETAIKAGADVILVGRGVIQAEDPGAEVQRYKEAAWKAYTAQ